MVRLWRLDEAILRCQQSGAGALLPKALAPSQGSYGRPNSGKDYLYFRSQQKRRAGLTDFGEKQNSRKLEFYARYYF